jgi:hypothetical protein
MERNNTKHALNSTQVQQTKTIVIPIRVPPPSREEASIRPVASKFQPNLPNLHCLSAAEHKMETSVLRAQEKWTKTT